MPAGESALAEKFDDKRAAFDAAVARHGLKLTATEAEGVHKLAAWMSEGLAGLDVDQADAEQAIADAALDLSLFEQGAMLRDGRLTSVALVEAYLRRIAARGPTYRAFYALDREGALAAAQDADDAFAQGGDIGHLHGIPIGIKDLIDVEGLATSANAPGRRTALAMADAEVVKRLRRAGAIVVGKL